MYRFTCDMCGKELEHHGQRYVMHIDEVSTITGWFKTYDLCGDCAWKIRKTMGKVTHDEDGD